MAFNLVQGDITELEVDAIVNAANSSLLGGGGVDGAIHRAAGPALLEECRTLHGCKAGQAKITKGYNLKAKNVIHTVGPIWQGGHNKETEVLENCYLNSLKLALENDIKTIAFPAISCGIFGYPIEKAAQIAVHTCRDFTQKHKELEVTFCLFSKNDLDIYKRLCTFKPFSCNLQITDRILGSLYGSAVGDALGVPVEFMTREQLQETPVKGMRGHGTHNQAPGTWSDDTSLSLCTIASLLEWDFNRSDIMKRFSDWSEKGYMTPHGEAFDIGMATSEALLRYKDGKSSNEWGCKNDWQNGNGSLMRILPLSLYTMSDLESTALEKSFLCSSLTHAHLRSQVACGYFTLLVRKLINGESLEEAMDYAGEEISPYMPKIEQEHFSAILDRSIFKKTLKEISSSSYVIHSLEAALYCAHNTKNYKHAVLMAVNLGDDTDTIGCITGAIAGLIYGKEEIPENWIGHLANLDMLNRQFNLFTDKICNRKKL